MIYFSDKNRSTQEEIMDGFDLKGLEMEKVLTDLKTVNRLLGGNGITINGISELLENIESEREITIIDLGCGDGEMLRQCARFGNKKGYNFKLIGIDGNANILDEAQNRSKAFKNISFKTMDVFSEEKFTVSFDIALCTLFLHHFPEHEIQTLLKKLVERAKLGVVVNDLHRSKMAFDLFKIFSAVFLRTKTARYDGLVSVARGFKKKELEAISENITTKKVTIQWKWAFRYQWILR